MECQNGFDAAVAGLASGEYRSKELSRALVWMCQRWNSWTASRRSAAKAFVTDASIDQEREYGDRR